MISRGRKKRRINFSMKSLLVFSFSLALLFWIYSKHQKSSLAFEEQLQWINRSDFSKIEDFDNDRKNLKCFLGGRGKRNAWSNEQLVTIDGFAQSSNGKSTQMFSLEVYLKREILSNNSKFLVSSVGEFDLNRVACKLLITRIQAKFPNSEAKQCKQAKGVKDR